MHDIRSPRGRILYSEAFKLKIIELVESGNYSLIEIMRTYDIGGHSTIYGWLHRYGKGDLIGNRQIVIKAEEINMMSKIKEKNKAVELENKEIALELYYSKALLECAFEQMNDDQKKSLYMKLSPEQLRRLKLMGIKCL